MEIKSITYEGKPCNHCGNTTRYVFEKRCVRCKAERNALKKKQRYTTGLIPRSDSYQLDYDFFVDDKKYFEGKPCRTCGSPHRYISTKRCVLCCAAKNRRLRDKLKGNQ